ncbi:antigen-presenting glycoprotein CD1d-like isoform X2 [Dama dama]|uniref:antigen-presenting glycoprotein CD1d-like isoform X2 n=1 Tax=Dama dama TaxID=30532 RepID=UPI002A35D3CF|nr:antigen-presenting glycoprotein CD1d-like isoform X2 [Dama dama]
MSGTGAPGQRAARGSRAEKAADARGGRAQTDTPREAGSLTHQPENLLLPASSCLAPGDRARFRASRHHPFFPNLAVCLFLLLFLLPSVLSLPCPRCLRSALSPEPQTSYSFRGLQISSFANGSWTRTDGLGWLGELQLYTWRNESDTVGLLKPWSQGTFSEQQWEQLQHTFQVYRRSFTRDIWQFVEMLHRDYPLEIQITLGCELLRRNTSESYFRAAFQGKDVLSFQGMSWVPAPDAPPWSQDLCKVLNRDQGTKETVHWLLHDVWPELVRGLLQTGKSELERQVKPEAWLSSGTPPRAGRLRLVCHVSGFYPKPMRVMWVRGEQEEPGTQQGDVMPNADSTWYLRVTLDVEAAEAAGQSCRVKHSSLGDQDIILNWDGNRVSRGLIVVLVILVVFVLLVVGGLVFWFRKHRTKREDVGLAQSMYFSKSGDLPYHTCAEKAPWRPKESYVKGCSTQMPFQ